MTQFVILYNIYSVLFIFAFGNYIPKYVDIKAYSIVSFEFFFVFLCSSHYIQIYLLPYMATLFQTIKLKIYPIPYRTIS